MLLGIELNYLVHRLPVAQARRELHELLVHCRFLIRSHNYGVAVRIGSCEIAGYGAEGDIILVIVFLYIVLADRLFAALVIDIIEKSVARGVGGLYFHERLLRHAELLIVARENMPKVFKIIRSRALFGGRESQPVFGELRVDRDIFAAQLNRGVDHLLVRRIGGKLIFFGERVNLVEII